MAQALTTGEYIQRRLRPMRARLRLRDWLLLITRTLWIAPGGFALMQLLGRLTPIPNLLIWSLVPPALWLLAMLGYGLFRRLPIGQVARRVDAELGLRERLATAIELSGQAERQPLGDAQLADAHSYAGTLRPRMLPLTIARRPLQLALVPLALGVALALLPNPQNQVLRERAAVQQAITQIADQTQQLRQQLGQDQALTPEQRAALDAQLAELERKLRENSGSREQALADLSTIENQLQQRVDPNADARQAALENLSRNLQSMSGQPPPAQQPSLSQAADQLNQLAQQLDQMTPEQRQQLAQNLSQQAGQLGQSDPQLAQNLSQAAQSLQQGNSQQAQQALQQAAQNVRQAQQQQAQQQALQQSLGQLQQSRQSVAQAGQQGQQAQQQQGQQGQQQGQQGQQGQGSGNGQGSGPRNNQNGQGQGGQTGQNTGQGSGGGSEAGTGHEDTVYQPYNPANGQNRPEQIQGQQGQGGSTQTQQGQTNLPGVANPALVPYQQNLPQYQRAAGEALDQSAIPPHLKDYVRDYFSNLEPKR